MARKKDDTTRYKIEWINPNDGRAVAIEIRHTRNYLVKGTDHVEIESLKPKRAPLPVTETGYRSEFVGALDLINAGGPVAFVKALLAREETSKAWLHAESKRRQGDLFQWAATEATRTLTKAARPARKRKTAPAAKPKPR